MNFSPAKFIETESEVAAPPRVRLAAVVVTHNRLEKLRRTVESLKREAVDVIYIVDNGCRDGTTEWLRDEASVRIRPIYLRRNTGGAGGFEAGIRQALDDGEADWLVLMDDDARPSAKAIDTFRRKADDLEDERVLAAAVFFPDGEICEMNRPSVNPFWNGRVFLRTLFGGGRMGFHIPDKAFEECEGARPIDIASFVGFFIPVSIVRRVGLPDRRLFIYGDDVLYSLRLRRAGVPIDFDPDIRFEHECGTKDRETGKVKQQAKWKIYYLYRNGILMYRAFAGAAFPLVLPVFLVKWFLTIEGWKPERRLERSLFFLAIRDGLLGHRSRPHSEILLRAKLPEMETVPAQ